MTNTTSSKTLLLSRLLQNDPSLRSLHLRVGGGRSCCQDILDELMNDDERSSQQQQQEEEVAAIDMISSFPKNTAITSLHLDFHHDDDINNNDDDDEEDEESNLLVALACSLTNLTRFVVTMSNNGGATTTTTTTNNNNNISNINNNNSNSNADNSNNNMMMMIGRVITQIIRQSKQLQTISLNGCGTASSTILDSQYHIDTIARAIQTRRKSRSSQIITTFQLKRSIGYGELLLSDRRRRRQRRRQQQLEAAAGVGDGDDDGGGGGGGDDNESSSSSTSSKVDLSNLVHALITPSSSLSLLRTITFQHHHARISDSALASLFNTSNLSSSLERISFIGIELGGEGGGSESKDDTDEGDDDALKETCRSLTLSSRQSRLHTIEFSLVDFGGGNSATFRKLVDAMSSSTSLTSTLQHLAIVSLSLQQEDYVALASSLSNYQVLRRLDMTASVIQLLQQQPMSLSSSYRAKWMKQYDRELYQCIGSDGFQAFVNVLQHNSSLQHVMFPMSSGYDRTLLQMEYPVLYKVLKMYLKLNRLGRSQVLFFHDRNTKWNQFVMSLLSTSTTTTTNGSGSGSTSGILDCSWKFLLLNPSVVTG